MYAKVITPFIVTNIFLIPIVLIVIAITSLAVNINVIDGLSILTG